MASISRDQALQISHADVQGSFLKDNPSDQLLRRLHKVKCVGDAFQVTDIAALATATFQLSGGTADASATTYATPARSYSLQRIPAKVELNADIAQNVSQINDVFQQQIQAKMVAMWNQAGLQLIYGTGLNQYPAGLQVLANSHPDGVIVPLAGAGTSLTLDDLDNMIKRVRPWDGNVARAFVVNRGQYAKICKLCHASGFTPPVLPDPILGEPLVHYLGIPILVSDFIADTEDTDRTSVYLVVLGAREGEALLGGVVWCFNEDTGPGIRVDGPHRSSTTNDVLFADLELNIGFASMSAGAVLRLSSVAP